MKYTFEFTIAGCSTNCAHCYVNGGPAPQIKLANFKYCVQKLKSILDRLDGDIAVTLGNEIFCHDSINDVLNLAASNLSSYFSFCNYPVPTTGIALIDHNDRDQIITSLQTVGASGCMFALHGAEDAHNAIVCRRNAFSKLFEAVDYFSDRGFEILFNLIVSKTLCRDFEQLMQQLANYPQADIRLTVPLYVPTKRMRMYQIQRAEYQDCIHLAEKAAKYSIDTAPLLEHCMKHSANTVINNLQTDGFDYAEEKKKAVQWKFFNITQSGDLYFGNVGAHTKWLGNLFHTEEDKLLSAILACDPNYDYIAYYPEDVFLSLEQSLSHLPPRVHNYVYSSKEDCIYALLDEIGIQSALI